MYIAYSAPSMAIYPLFFGCLATIAMAPWKIFETVILFLILNNM